MPFLLFLEVGGLVAPCCAYTCPWGVVATVVGVEKEREVGVLMLEELEHQATDMDNKEVGKNYGKQVGKKEEACCILDTCYQEGGRC